MQNSLAGKGPFPPNIRQLPAVRWVILPTEFVSSYQTFKRFRSLSRISWQRVLWGQQVCHLSCWFESI
jgi:hypothetical protein